MEKKDGSINAGRRNVIKTLGISSIALLGGLGNFSLAYGNQSTQIKTGPDDGPNQPMGNPMGVNPGRVVWAWNPKATNSNCTNDYKTRDFYFNPENFDQKVIGKMFSDSVKKLTGKNTVAKSWDALFRYHNVKKSNTNKGYTKGEKIFIKINQTSGRGALTPDNRREGKYYYPEYNATLTRPQTPVCETTPPLALELLRHLVNECGIEQANIAIGDNQNPIWGHNYDAWVAEFPNVIYTDCMFETFGRTLVKPTENDLQFYSDKRQKDKLYDVIENADYLISLPNLKPHRGAGITLGTKNHFGSQARPRADHLHYAHPGTVKGYRKYRVLVDIMGNRYLGQNTLLTIVDGLWGGGSGEVGAPVKYFMAPFNNNWCNSIFISQDMVALESVCYDFLRTEWNGINSHDPINNKIETNPNVNGVDDYLHQAADSSNWPEGLIYDPNNTGMPIASVGVHEHWNNADDKQYSRNLGTGKGIELVSIPESLVKNKA
jgi:hypothetical protein